MRRRMIGLLEVKDKLKFYEVNKGSTAYARFFARNL